MTLLEKEFNVRVDDREPRSPRTRWSSGRVAYVLLFVLVLPASLALWARALDGLVVLPRLHSPVFGSALAVAGVALMLASTITFWIYGGGLPASPYPPARLVTRGPYRYLADPIYVGAVLVVAGVALALGSAAGIWIVTPALTLAIAAWVMGFERQRTRALFGEMPAIRISLPPPLDRGPAGWERASVYMLVFLPWFVLYMAVELLGVRPGAYVLETALDRNLPVLPWTEAIYAATYPFVLSVPLLSLRARDLRSFARSALVATAIFIPFYLLVPIVFPAKPVSGSDIWSQLMLIERAFDSPATAFPAFHVIWAFLAAKTYSRAAPRRRVLWWTLASAIAISCITTGLHSWLDVIAGLAFFVVVQQWHHIWTSMLKFAERVANSWGEITVGPVRFLNHGIYAAVGALLGLILAVTLAGSENVYWLAGMTAATVLAAALWAQLIEGSPVLLRPYGYYGAVAGAVGVAFAASMLGANAWLIMTAFGVGSSITYAFGRMRCLIQGCCHGRICAPEVGIRYSHPRSRVVHLTELGNLPLYPTPLYSMLVMLAIGAITLRLWVAGAPLSFIAGVYFFLAGVSRFVEEHYRGEPQTPVYAGLRLYQWMSLLSVVGGAVVTTIPSPAAPTLTVPTLTSMLALFPVALLVYFLYGVDFPRSQQRFSRLV